MLPPSSFRLLPPGPASAVLALLAAATGAAQIPLPAPGLVFTETFNTLGTTATAGLPEGWRMTAAGDATVRWDDATNLLATSAQASGGSPTAGGRYNWGQSATDRAPGFMSSSGHPSPGSLLAAFTNTSATVVGGVELGFEYERYRQNTTPALITFHHSLDGVNWTAAPAGDSGPFATGPSSYGFATPVSTVARTVNLGGLELAPGGSLYLRWTFDTGGVNSQGLGLDNVSLAVSAIPEPATVGLVLGFAALAGAWWRRRRRCRPEAAP